MTDKYLHPDKYLAVKYVIAAFLLYILDYLIPMLGLISIILLFIGLRAFQNDENNHFAISTSTVVGLIAMGISTIYFIYMTHYFTEGVLLDAKKAKVNFTKLGLNTPWIFLGAMSMIHYICVVTFSKKLIPSITVMVTFIFCLYYSVKLYQAITRVYNK